MFFMIASDFFVDYEIVKADNLEAVENYILSEGENTSGIEVIGNSDSIDYENAYNGVDKIVYISEYMRG